MRWPVTDDGHGPSRLYVRPHDLALVALQDLLAFVDRDVFLNGKAMADKKLDPAVVRAVGDPHLGRPHPLAATVLMLDGQAERAKADRAP